jgi:hypothetical protein
MVGLLLLNESCAVVPGWLPLTLPTKEFAGMTRRPSWTFAGLLQHHNAADGTRVPQN